MIAIPQALEIAVQVHQAGDRLRAEQLYREILQVDPQQVVALRMLGVIAHQGGKNDLAIEYITRALRLQPDYVEAHNSLGIALRNAGRLEEAVSSWREALRLAPDYAEALNNLRKGLTEQSKRDGAMASYKEILGRKKKYAEGQNKLDLSNVTLVTVDTANHELTRLAIEDCMRLVQFGEVLVFSDRDIGVGRLIPCPPLRSINAVDHFCWLVAFPMIQTSHLLYIHWDSWVLDPGMWSDEFFQYDYVGAPWWYDDGLNVGNSGFCLESQRLSQFLAANADYWPPRRPMDDTLCRKYRPQLEPRGFRWAPEEAAARFSFEYTWHTANSRHFGFHDIMNWPFVLTEAELRERTKFFTAYQRAKPAYQAMLDNFEAIYGKPFVEEA